MQNNNFWGERLVSEETEVAQSERYGEYSGWGIIRMWYVALQGT